ncbi:MAG: hypothetical protein IJE27_00085 [Anaerotignum sp.]|nr:hypothetical protein [Anaerotignum sp.]
MENNQNPNLTPNGRPPRKQMAPRDMFIIAVVVLVLTRINWTQMNSFNILIIALMFLMLMLRWANMRKEATRQQTMERYKKEYEDEQAAKYAEQLLAEARAAAAAKAAAEASSTEEAPAAPTEEKAE